MAGFLLGGLSGGMAADRYGRKKVWLIALTANCILGTLCAFSTSLNMFYILRFLQGIFIQSGTLTTFVLSTEMIGTSYRGKDMEKSLKKMCYYLCVDNFNIFP